MSNFQQDVINKLNAFSTAEPEIVFQWKDKLSPATGTLVINSLRGGAAGGGTRLHNNVTLDEITTLAKIMEIKFALSGPAIGGAKTGIKMDPNDPHKYDVLERWYKAIQPLLKNYYGTGSDMNTDIHKINAILNKMDINNSQEGIINQYTKGDTQQRLGAFANMQLLKTKLNLGGGNEPLLAEMVTGYGVAASIIAYYKAEGKNVQGKKVFIQGAGNVGAAAAYYLNEQGAIVVAISDKDAGAFSKNGFSKEEIQKVLKSRCVLGTLENSLGHDKFYPQLLQTDVDIMIPAAGSNIITHDDIQGMLKNNLEVISCGANHPFKESEYCYGKCSQNFDNKLAILPDFLSNMGIARTFFAMMSNPTEVITPEFIFNDIDTTIQNAVNQAYANHNGKLMTASLYEIALNNINNTI
ncbi:Glu/Leu/Phe/Val dehydrogenase dimerization domain-containing protein [Francisellaceae bacterium CB299]|jgi:glutamate dehydrogenase/leucine dehydrogenase